MKYIVDTDRYDDLTHSGGSADFFRLVGKPKLGFKQFKHKRRAEYAYEKQKLLSKFGLAPRVYGKITKAHYAWGEQTGWGFVTERAKICDSDKMSKRLKSLQKLVDDIQNKTGLKFWDSHYWNVGYVKRNNKAKLVCVDTGSETFFRDCNSWGYHTPGPQCPECKKFNCQCC